MLLPHPGSTADDEAMSYISKKILRFLRCDDGPTAVEYAFMLMLIIVVCLTAVALFGDITANSFKDSNNQIEDAMSNGG